MRRLAFAILLVLLLVLVLPGHSTYATWNDSVQVPGAELGTESITPSLGCNDVGNSARVSWTPLPALSPTLVYTAELVAPASPLTPVDNAVTISPGLLDGLLGGLLGSALTVRVTATLPGTSWTASADRTVYYKLVLLTGRVSCFP